MSKTHWLEYVKEAAVQAVMSEKPCDYVTGTVTSVRPLKIKLSDGDGLELESDFLHLARNVTDYEMTVSITDEHGQQDMKTVSVHNALKKGEIVLILRKWGGQDYIVTDRVVS